MMWVVGPIIRDKRDQPPTVIVTQLRIIMAALSPENEKSPVQESRFENSNHNDYEKGSTERNSDYANSTAGLEHARGIKASGERRVLAKLDAVILPLTALLYVRTLNLLSCPNIILIMISQLSAYLDRVCFTPFV